VRTILEALDLDIDDAGYMSDRTTNGTSVRRSEKHELWQQQLANLKLRLQPLLSLEDQLTNRLSGTTPVTSYGTPLVRTGWQFTLRLGRRALRRPKSSHHDDPNASRSSFSSLSSETEDEDRDPTARMLQASAEDITELWHHPSVRAMLRRRRVLKLEDSAELYVVHFHLHAQAGWRLIWARTPQLPGRHRPHCRTPYVCPFPCSHVPIPSTRHPPSAALY
jgi:hypothetical protein